MGYSTFIRDLEVDPHQNMILFYNQDFTFQRELLLFSSDTESLFKGPHKMQEHVFEIRNNILLASHRAEFCHYSEFNFLLRYYAYFWIFTKDSHLLPFSFELNSTASFRPHR